ncbi:cytochrome P450 [Panaeolus papilionaceus]|nr:cytochrome P450 [Panaeolus papilionaceus]
MQPLHHYLSSILRLEDANVTYLVGVGLFLVGCWSAVQYYRSEARKLSHIPSVGSKSTLLGSLNLKFEGRSTLIEGSKLHDGLFKVPERHSWVVLTGNRSLMEDIRKAPEHVLSARRFFEYLLQAPYTFGSHTLRNDYHHHLIRGIFTKSIPLLVTDIHEELKAAFEELIPQTDEWTPVHISNGPAMHLVGRAINRSFVGEPLCQSSGYIASNVACAIDVMKTAVLLRRLPLFLKPVVGFFVSNLPSLLEMNKEFTLPIIQQRRAAMEEKGSEYEGKPNDFLQWLMDTAQGNDAKDDELAVRILLLNLAASHTTSRTFVHVTYHLAANPEFQDLLRQEVDEIIQRDGWTKSALDDMVVVDSFIKECLRLHPGGHTAIPRIALQDFTFSNGETIPKGTTVCASIHATHLDESIYPDPYTFNPLRFVNMASSNEAKRSEAGGSFVRTTRYDVTSTNLDALVFGYGKHACPGRFFAAAVIKLMVAYVVTHYDIKFEKEGVRSSDVSCGLKLSPNPSVQVFFRRRQCEMVGESHS